MVNNTIIKASDKQFVSIHYSNIKLWETKTSSFFDVEELCSCTPVKGNAHAPFTDGIIFNGKLILIERGRKESHIHIIDIKEEKLLKIKTICVWGSIATIKLKPKDSECVFSVFPYEYEYFHYKVF